jgi:hypothetical protein
MSKLLNLGGYVPPRRFGGKKIDTRNRLADADNFRILMG